MNNKLIKDFLLPTATQLFWCLTLATMSVVVVYRTVLLQRLTSSQAVSLGQVGETFKAQLANLNSYPAVQTTVIVIFWALVGLCTFAIYAAIRNSGSTVLDELTIGREYTNSSKSRGRFNWVAVRIGASIGLIIALQLVWRAGLPFWFGLIEQLMLGTLSLSSFFSFVMGFLGLALSYYILWLLLHTAIIADRL